MTGTVTFPDGTSVKVRYDAVVSHVIAVKIQGRWKVSGGFVPGEEDVARAEADRIRSTPRYEDVQVLAVAR